MSSKGSKPRAKKQQIKKKSKALKIREGPKGVREDEVSYAAHARYVQQEIAKKVAKRELPEGSHGYPVPKDLSVASLSFAAPKDPVQVVGTNVLNIPSTMRISTLQEVMLTYLSTQLFTNVIGSFSSSNDNINAWQQTFEGLAYLLQAIVEISKGGTIELDSLPRVCDVMTQLLTEKTVRLAAGVVRYSPKWDTAPELPGSFTTPTGAVYALIQPDEQNQGNFYAMSTMPITPSSDSYSTLLKLSAGNKTFGGEIVKYRAKTGLYTVDPSAYARQYSYFGSGGTQDSGLYNNTELEAPYAYPMFSRFVPYDPTDKVVSRIYHPTGGGINAVVGLSILNQYNYSLLRNPIPVIYKFVDFNQIYNVVGAYMVSLFEQSVGMTPAMSDAIRPFSFTSADFRVLLRQAVLTQFSSQCHGQFVAPQKTAPTSNNSVFEPFLMDPLTCPSQAFSTMLLPQLVVENLNMLKPRCTNVTHTSGSAKYQTKPQKLQHNFVPVWGVYSGDVPIEFQYKDQNGQMQFLFAQGDPWYDVRLWDGVVNANPSVKADLNFQTKGYLSEWNNVLLNNKNKSTPLSPVGSDKGPGASLLMYTRVLSFFQDGTYRATDKGKPDPDPYAAEFYKNIANKPRPRKEEKTVAKKSGPSIKAVQPATYFDLFTESILSHQLLSNDFQAALRYFVLPSIRLDASNSATDPITLPSYSVYTGEVCVSSNNVGGISADNEAARAFLTGQLMVAGLFAPDSTNDVITQALKLLTAQGMGSDLIKSILGGMASLIPGVGGVISQVIQGI